jgi:hypothetical protein
MTRDSERVLAAFKQLPETARVPAVWNELGRVYEGLNSQDDARAAYQNALQKDPNYTPAKVSLKRLDDVTFGQQTSHAPLPKRDEVNLLSPAQGGQLLIAPSADWERVISGNDDDTLGLGGGCPYAISPMEATFAFKDEKPATFAKFAMLIPRTGNWVEKFELFAGDDTPTGTFRPLGQFQTDNQLHLRTPYQEFNLPETTAKYFKLKLLSVHGGCSPMLTQIRLMGKPP